MVLQSKERDLIPPEDIVFVPVIAVLNIVFVGLVVVVVVDDVIIFGHRNFNSMFGQNQVSNR